MYYGSPAYNTFTRPGFHDVELRVYDSRGAVGVTHILIHVQSSLAGDLDGDGQLGAGDVNALSAAIATGSEHPAFDVNRDGGVDLDDLHFWVVDLKQTLMGDANLDTTVDGQDFGVWNSHKFTYSTAWTDGNFNADPVVDDSDFAVWNANKFQSALQFGSATNQLEQSASRDSVPARRSTRAAIDGARQFATPGAPGVATVLAVAAPSDRDPQATFRATLRSRHIDRVFAAAEDEDPCGIHWDWWNE
jgi:hypothetical protein